MTSLVIDVETTTFQKGNPYSAQNSLCLVGTSNNIYDIEYTDHAYTKDLAALQKEVDEASVLVVFNGKFDLAWLSRYGINFSDKRIWDCQLVHFILSGQKDAYPSLNGVASKYNLGTKIDVVKEEYWNKGIDTKHIPHQVLYEYLKQDINLTQEIFKRQVAEVLSAPLPLQRLISLSNQDTLVLLEMEKNGIFMDWEGMSTESITISNKITSIRKDLNDYFNDVSDYCRNYSSGDALSCLLYGGERTEEIRTENGVYKTGAKAGQPKYKLHKFVHTLPRRFEPLPGSELKKPGFYATNEETLRSLKTDKEGRRILNSLIELSKLEKLLSTYFDGLQKLYETNGYEGGILHGRFNQVVAITGRLSSSGPNLQNIPPDVDKYIVTRF